MWILGLKMALTEHSWVSTTCAPKRAFQIEVVCAILTLVAKVMPNLLPNAQYCLNYS